MLNSFPKQNFSIEMALISFAKFTMFGRKCPIRGALCIRYALVANVSEHNYEKVFHLIFYRLEF